MSQNEIEYRILEQVAHKEDTLLKRKQKKRNEISIVFPYNGATVCFVICILAAFGISAIRFERSSSNVKVCKIKVDGIIISEQELLSIVHKIELIFHMAEHHENYK